MGITRIANVTGLDRIGIPVAMVTRPNARSVAVSQGKGLDLDSAKASALMESIETWHAEHISRPVRYGTFSDMQRDHLVVSPASLPQMPHADFNETTRILWIEGTNLFDGASMLVPFEMVHADYTQPGPPGHGHFHCSTNGLASGNHVSEAQCHAICEIIERDATTLLHHMTADERSRRAIDKTTIDDPACKKLILKMHDAGLDIVVWDTTSDTGVPSFYGLLVGPDNEIQAACEHIGAGAGCHPCKNIALARTLTEAAQTRLTYISGARDDLLAAEFEDDDRVKKHRAAHEFIARTSCLRRYGDIESHDSQSMDDDLDWLLGKLATIGLSQAICIDLTKPEIDIPVVRMIVPGLEAPHDDDSFMPGPRVGKAS